MHSGRPPPRRKNPTDELDIFASPEKSGERKLRRNSESSLMDRPPMTEEERRRREKHRREREARHRDSKRDGSRSRHPRKKPHGLDLIDKLDVTGIYGPGCEFAPFPLPTYPHQSTRPFHPVHDFLVPGHSSKDQLAYWLHNPVFHHDGPFDACNPHRNRKKDHRAPMQAFPDGSANMNLGGAGPLHSTLDLNKIHGTGTEGYKDFGTGYDASGRRPDASRGLSFDPYARTEPVHGEETFGLGTSTFLEGAPASRKAIERRESELEAQQRAELAAGGIGRKKSIAQRIRGMSTGRPRPLHAAGSIRSPEGRYADRVNGAGATSPEQASPPTLKPLPDQSQSAGGPSRAPVTLTDEKNPFESIYDEAYDKKMAEIKAAKEEKKEAVTGRARALSSPKKGVGFPLERRATTDTNEEGAPAAGMASGTETAPEAKSIGGGFLDRVKSLKGGRKPIRHPS